MAAPKPLLGLMFQNFGPYHVSRISAAAEALEVIAIEAAPQDREYAWDQRDLPGSIEHARFGPTSTGDGVRRELDRIFAGRRPAALAIPGWFSLQALAATDWAYRHGIPIVGMSDSNAFDAPRRAATERLKRSVVAHYSAGFAAGPSQEDYLVSLSLPLARITLGYDVVDNAYFKQAARQVRETGAMPDPSLGFPPAAAGRYFLCVARFVEKKNLAGLIDAYAMFRAGRSVEPDDWPLVLVGDGPLRPALAAQTDRLGLNGFVHFPGFRQIAELPPFYGSAGAFIHASKVEQWGLVVNEAMASGLPVAVSDRCGCVDALIREDCGLLFDPDDLPAMAGVLERLAGSGKLRAELADRGAERISDWGLDRFVAGLMGAVETAQLRKTAPTIVDRVVLKAMIALQQRRAAGA